MYMYRTVILSVVSHEFQTGSLRFRMSENRALRRILGSNMEAVTGQWRKMNNEGLQNFSSPAILEMLKSRRMRWAHNLARIRKIVNIYKILVGRLEGQISLGRPRRRWEDNIKMGRLDVDWMYLAHNRD